MKSAKSLAIALTLGALLTGTAYANNPYHFMSGQSLFGQPTASVQNARVVDVTSSNSVNIRYGELVKFVNGDKSFAWVFNGLDNRAVDLASIAPSGFGGASMKIFIDRDQSMRN